MKYPAAWGKSPVELNAFKSDLSQKLLTAAPTELVADGEVARWWNELSEEGKAEYVAEHPNSKYAEMHRKIQGPERAPAAGQGAPVETAPQGHQNDKKAPGTKSEPLTLKNHDGQQKPSQMTTPSARPGQGRQRHENGHGHPKMKTKPANPPHEAPVKPGLKEFAHPDMKPGSGKRKAIVSFLKKKSSHIISHLKHDAKEWKTAGIAMKKLATGKPLEHGDKHAMGAVAADLAAVTASLMLTGGAAHGIIAFMHHFGAHLAQEAMLKAAVKGAAGAAHHASIRILSSESEEDEIMQRALAYMMDVLENGDLEELMKKFEGDAKKDGKGAEEQRDVHEASVEASRTKLGAKLDMSADVAGRGLCPDCKRQMTIAMVGDVPSWSCETDRISLPLPDDHEYFTTQTLASPTEDKLRDKPFEFNFGQ